MLLIKTGIHDSSKSGFFYVYIERYTYGLKGMRDKMLTCMLPQNKKVFIWIFL